MALFTHTADYVWELLDAIEIIANYLEEILDVINGNDGKHNCENMDIMQFRRLKFKRLKKIISTRTNASRGLELFPQLLVKIQTFSSVCLQCVDEKRRYFDNMFTSP